MKSDNNNNNMSIRRVNISNFFYIGDNIIEELDDILREGLLSNDNNYTSNNNNIILVVSGINNTKHIGDKIALTLNTKTTRLCINSNDSAAINTIKQNIESYKPSLIIGVGGGKVLDVCKYVCYITSIPLLAIPTTLSHDGIASPVSVLRLNDLAYADSIGSIPPMGIVIDIDVVKNAPMYTTLAGIGDLISNISAVEDWKLAHEYRNEPIDRFAEIVSRNAAERFLYYILKNNYDDNESTNMLEDKRFLIYLAEGLIQSGIAMSIAGSSRPASGAEHLISHALDRILDKPNPHGLQVGLATIFTMALRGSCIDDIVRAYRYLSMPYKPEMMNINKETFLKAVKLAPSTRKNRFTILDIVDEHDIERAYRIAYEGYLGDMNG